MPAFAYGVLARVPEPIPLSDEHPGARLVLDLPRPVLDRVGALDADRHLGVVSEVNHLVRGLDHAAAPALGRTDRVSVLDSRMGDHDAIVLRA
jgi:hypothetical protein